MQNFLTFDLEDWYHGNFLFDKGEADYTESRVLEPTLRLLEILRQTKSYATFFTLGVVAEKFPGLIEKIVEDGHEVASHGYYHKLVYKLEPDEFKRDIDRSIRVLERLTGKKVLGFRAPYWSIYPDMKWAFETLKAAGLQYDSSVYPFKTYLYGDNAAPRFRYEIDCSHGTLKEFPPSVMEKFKMRIPFSGGFYFRLFPLWLIRKAITDINKKEKQPVVFYLHPYEIDPRKNRNSKGFKNNFILHVNVKKAEIKLRKLLAQFNFISFAAALT